MNTTGKRAAIYTRVSRDDTGEGKSNQRQREDCEKLADLRGWDVVAVEEDVSISGYGKRQRPAWERVLGMVERGEIDVVIAWHIDRMTRNMRDLERLITIAEDQGVGVATVSGDIDLTTDVGRMVARILAAVARAEVERKAARQKRANEQRAAQGLPWQSGFRAFGYTLDGQIVEEEAELLRAAAEDVLEGTPLRAIVRRWNELEVPTPRRNKHVNGWTHNAVRAILLNPRHAGIATYKGEVIGTGQWEPIIPEETHVLLVATLTDPSRSRGEKTLGNKPRNLLSGIATCGECGWKVEAGSTGGRMVYKCSNPKGDHITTDRAGAEEIVRSAFASAAALTLPGTVSDRRDKEVPVDLWERRKTLNERLDKLATSWANGALTDGQLEAASTSLRAQLAEVETEIEDAASEPEETDLRSEEVKRFLELDLWGQRKVLADLTEIKLWSKNRRRKVSIKQQVTVYINDKRGRTWAALDERRGNAPDPSASAYEGLAGVLVREQPEGITTLAKASVWLVDSGHTDRKASGLPSKLSPLVRYVRSESRGASGWTRKSEGQAADE